MPRIGRGTPNFGPRLPQALATSRLGNTTGGGSTASVASNSALASSIIPSQTVTVDSIFAWVSNPASATQPLVFAVYSDASGLPGTLLASVSVSQASIGSSAAFFGGSITPLTLTAGTRYWIVLSSATPGSNSYTVFFAVATNASLTPPGPILLADTGSTSGPWTFHPGALTAYVQSHAEQATAMLGPHPGVGGQVPFSGYYHPRQGQIGVSCTAVARARNAHAYFPAQWYEGSETDVTTNGVRTSPSSIVVYPERSLGPDPPAVVAFIPPPAPPIQVNTAVDLLRRRNMLRRFPWQGWAQEETALTASETITNDYVAGDSQSASQIGIGISTSQIALAQQFPRLTGVPLAVLVRIGKNSTPSDGVQLQIQSDAGGVPSGTVLASSQVVDGSAIPVTNGAATPQTAFYFPTVSVTGPVWVVFTRTGAVSGSQFYQLIVGPTLTGAAGPVEVGFATDNNGTWTASARLSTAFVQFVTTTNVIPLQRRFLGPRPPAALLPLPTQPQQTVSVTFAAAQSRRSSESRRFPLQGWEQVPSQAGAVTFDNATDGGNTLLFSHAVGTGVNGYLTVSMALASSTVFSSSVTYAGAPMTLLHREVNVGFNITTELWGLLAPASGSNPVVVTLNGATPGVGVGATSFFGVDQADPTDGTALGASGGGSGAATSQAKTGSPGDMLVDGIGATGGPWNSGSGTIAWQDGGGEGQQYVPATGSPQTFTWTQSPGTPNWVEVIALLNAASVGQVVLAQRLIGPRPPLVVAPAQPVETTITVALSLPQSIVRREQAQRRAPKSLLFPVGTLAQPPPTDTTVSVALVRIRPRRPSSLYTQARYLSPLAVVTTPGQLVVSTHRGRTRPRPIRSALPLIIGSVSAVAPPIQTNLVVADRIERRRFNSFLAPPTTLQTFSGPQVTTVRTRPRRFAAKYVNPATLEPETVAIAERTIRTALVRTRPRHTLGTKLSYVVYPATSAVTVALVRTRPRPTHVTYRGLIFYAVSDTTILVQNVRTRPRPTTRFVRPPATLQPYSVTVAEDTVRTSTVRTRPRPTTRRLSPPTALQTFGGPRTPLTRIRPRPTARFVAPPATLEPETVALSEREIRVALTRTRPRPTTRRVQPPTVLQNFGGPATTLARTRPRPTAKRLTSITYPATSEITVALTRTRPRPFRNSLGALIFYAQTSEVQVTLTRARPRHTVATVRPPAITAVAQAFYGPAVTLARIRPRRVVPKLSPPVFYAQTSEVQVTLVRTRPRPTAKRLTTVYYPATSDVSVTLVRARSRPRTSFVAPPSTLQPYSVTVSEDTVRTSTVRTRPRHTVGTNLAEPTVLQTFSGPQVTLVRTRPRPTVKRVSPPTAVRVPSVEQREQTIGVTTVRTRPRATARFIVPPLVKTFPPVVTTIASWTVAVPGRRGWTTRFSWNGYEPVHGPQATGSSEFEGNKRRGDHNYRLGPRRPQITRGVPFLREQTVKVTRVRTRPRHTISRLAPPTTLQVFGPPVETEVAVRTPVEDRAHRRAQSFAIRPVTYPATSEVSVSTVRTRPRHTISRLAPPTTLQVFGPPVETEVAVRTPVEDRAHRRVRSFQIQPIAVRVPSVEQREDTVSVTLVRTRPRPTRSSIAPPTALRTFRAASVSLVRTLPRRTHSTLAPPAVVTFPESGTVSASLVRTRPRSTVWAVRPPIAVRPVPLAAPTRTLAVRARPRPTTTFLLPPSSLRIFIPNDDPFDRAHAVDPMSLLGQPPWRTAGTGSVDRPRGDDDMFDRPRGRPSS